LEMDQLRQLAEEAGEAIKKVPAERLVESIRKNREAR